MKHFLAKFIKVDIFIDYRVIGLRVLLLEVYWLVMYVHFCTMTEILDSNLKNFIHYKRNTSTQPTWIFLHNSGVVNVRN
ncbi:hypothetical protein AQUCO_02700442v1 [Aquilegia coerulea]|uniref:Uncharacterized protein n=1 Tax=Aquilegia coerulea TaxID=218851 RepID=A0A2G5D7S6_AQUCA|nr:hypothetical protein AQUCO_02700442v1 [Aquilegia coerulea]